MEEQYDLVAAAFSGKAASYDDFGRDHPNLDRMRRRVYDHISGLVAPPGFLLELNAGTGLDAVAMVERGYRVHATELAPGMLRAIQAKIARYGLQGHLTVEQCSFTRLDQLNSGPYDGIFSNFGGLNCVANLRLVTRHLPHLLRPGGTVTFVVMPHVCPWELARAVKDFKVATRRLRPGGIVATVAGVQFVTTYFSAAEALAAFGPRFEPVAQEGLSVTTPPADNKRFARQHPRWYRLLAGIDDRVARWPVLKGWGDFFILSMRFKG